MKCKVMGVVTLAALGIAVHEHMHRRHIARVFVELSGIFGKFHSDALSYMSQSELKDHVDGMKERVEFMRLTNSISPIAYNSLTTNWPTEGPWS